jgi:hypothetical protein
MAPSSGENESERRGTAELEPSSPSHHPSLLMSSSSRHTRDVEVVTLEKSARRKSARSSTSDE